jgi:hypothetical protein
MSLTTTQSSLPVTKYVTALCQVSCQRSQLERDQEEQKQKLLRSEQSQQASQNKEQDLRKKFEVGHDSWNFSFKPVMYSSVMCSFVEKCAGLNCYYF